MTSISPAVIWSLRGLRKRADAADKLSGNYAQRLRCPEGVAKHMRNNVAIGNAVWGRRSLRGNAKLIRGALKRLAVSRYTANKTKIEHRVAINVCGKMILRGTVVLHPVCH